MGHRTYRTAYRTKEEAEKAASDRGVPGYSEVYLRSGPTPCKLTDGTDGWVIEQEEYYG